MCRKNTNHYFSVVFHIQLLGSIILPQSVLKVIDRCRDIYGGHVEVRGKWPGILFVVLRFGGLNIKGCKILNTASVGELL